MKFEAERTAYEAQIMQLKHKIAEMEAIIVDVTKDNQRLTGLYHEKNKEYETLKQQTGSGGFVSLEDFERLQRENTDLKKNLMVRQKREEGKLTLM